MAEKLPMGPADEKTNPVPFRSIKHSGQQRLPRSDILFKLRLKRRLKPVVAEKKEHLRPVRGVQLHDERAAVEQIKDPDKGEHGDYGQHALLVL